MMIVKGKAYRTRPSSIIQLWVLRKMKAEFGLGWGTVQTYMSAMSDDDLLGDLLGDDEFLAWMYAWIHNAGDTTSRAELEQLTVGDIEFTESDGPDAGEPPKVDPVPTSAPTDSARGDADPPGKPAKRTRASSKTSKQRSTPAS